MILSGFKSRGVSSKIIFGAILSVVMLWHAPRVYALNGGDTIRTDVVLDKDLTTTRNLGLYIDGNDITIDGNGHSLKFTGSQTGFRTSGIYCSNRKNITIKNFSKISGFDIGVMVSSGENIKIINCQIEGNNQSGIQVQSSGVVTLEDNVIRETHTALDFSSNYSSTTTLTNNTIIGGRVGVSGKVGVFTGNRLIHQAQSTMSRNQRLFRFADVDRTGPPGQRFNFSFNMLLIGGGGSPDSTYTVRTVPPTQVSASKNSSTVTGHFTPTRPGLHALVVEVTDANSNIETRMASIFVGPMVERSKKYYWTHIYPQHGQTHRAGNDTGGMSLTAPTVNSFRECGGWVQESPDELSSLPAVLLRKVDFNLLIKFNPPVTNTYFGIERDVSLSPATPTSKRVDVPDAWGDGDLHWANLSVDNVDWSLDYPVEWYYLSVKFIATDLYVETGKPNQLSNNVFHYATTSSPEVRSITGGDRLLLLSATAATVEGGGITGEQLTLWGAKAQGDLTLANFKRPFMGVPTLIDAAGETHFNSGLVDGEKIFSAVPLDVSPTTNAIRLEVGNWITTGEERREWSEVAVGDAGTVAHTLGGLLAGGNYRVTVGGSELLTAQADTQGKLSFVYGGGFPAAFIVTPVPLNPPAPPGLVTLRAQDQRGQDVQDAVIYVRELGAWYAAGTQIQLTVGQRYRFRGKISGAQGPEISLPIIDTTTEIMVPFRAATLRANDQFGAAVSGAQIKVRNYFEEWFAPGTLITLPSGYNAQIYGKALNATGPRQYVRFDSSLTEVNPGFWTFSIHTRDQFGAVVSGGLAQLRNVLGETFTDGTRLTLPKGDVIKTRSRRSNLISNVYENVTFSDGLNIFSAKFRRVLFKAVATDGNTLVPDAEIYLYNSQLARFANNTRQGIPVPDTIRVRVYKDNVIIADVNPVAFDATTDVVVIPTTFEVNTGNTDPVMESGPLATPDPAEVGQAVSFHVGATDVDGDTLTYTWRFGDGTSSSGPDPWHTYSAVGIYSVRVSVTDGNGGLVEATMAVVVQDSGDPQLDIKAVVVKGTVFDVSGVTSLKVGGQQVTVEADGSWQHEVSLGGELTTVTVEATDPSGNVTMKRISITR